jgi:AbrB family looped-hinge helix DNA binding protein
VWGLTPVLFLYPCKQFLKTPPLEPGFYSNSSFLRVAAACANLTSKTKEKVMQTLATTKMTSKGQVVIPEAVRTRLGLHTGDQFVVVGNSDVVILKTIRTPSLKEFDGLISTARKQARTAGMKISDIKNAVKTVRSR